MPCGCASEMGRKDSTSLRYFLDEFGHWVGSAKTKNAKTGSDERLRTSGSEPSRRAPRPASATVDLVLLQQIGCRWHDLTQVRRQRTCVNLVRSLR